MVKAILDGHKTQTRRVVKPQLGPQASWHVWEGLSWRANGLMADIPSEWRSKVLYSHYGDPGDRLWVRETWAETEDEWGCPIIAWKAGGSRVVGADGERRDGTWRQFIIEDSTSGAYEVETWRPSIHMPRWASRITLEITGVEVERLNEITSADVVAEGFPFSSDLDYFKVTWNDLNAKRGYGWETSPWVWAIAFKRVTQDLR